MTKTIDTDILDRLKAAAGADGWSQDPARIGPKLTEWRRRWSGMTPLLLSPNTTEKVAAIVAVCAQTRTALTLQGGNTGLVGGQIPQGEVLLSLERMTAIRDLNLEDDVIVAEAGVVLAVLRAAANTADRHFPLGLASEGSCTIGGLISTNAGGTAVLRYGSMRALVLGVEAVFPNGEIHHGLTRLRKDNTGYDLNQLLVGAEGTLGVVTAASLKLYPRLAARAVAVAAVRRPIDAVTLLGRAKRSAGGNLEAFELLGRAGVDLAIRHLPGIRDPLAEPTPWMVLIELARVEAESPRFALEQLLAEALEADLITDAAIAQNEVQADRLWAIREGQSAAQIPEGAVWKHDVATPISQIAAFIDQATGAVAELAPGARVVAFGHLGDGNIHFDVLKPPGGSDLAHDQGREEGARRIHDIATALGGTVSAEHGLGAMKSKEALRYKAPADVAVMRAIRAALDPHRILNPRVLF